MLIKAIKYCLEYLLGNIYAFFLYDKKYIFGRFFRFGKRGWKWCIYDGRARRHLGINKGVPFPVSFANRVNTPNNIIFSPNDLHIFQGSGKYFQAEDAKIYIGEGCYIANNVGIITTNHDLLSPDNHMPGKDISIGSHSWIGMNSMILPGVILGDHTVVGAGSVVTKSFPDGYCVIAGNPAKKMKDLKS